MRPFVKPQPAQTKTVSSVAREPAATVPAYMICKADDRETPFKSLSDSDLLRDSDSKSSASCLSRNYCLTSATGIENARVTSCLFGSAATSQRKCVDYIADTVANYKSFRDCLVSLFEQLKFEGADRSILRNLR